MATADLITSFLSNEMSPERERQFLLSVAASDALRLELKSHMLLDRILLGQAQRSRVPDAVRATIFAAAGVGTAAATTTAADAKPAAPAAPRGGFFNRLGGRAAMLIAAGACFGAGYFLGLAPNSDAPAAPRVEQRSVPAGMPSAATPAPTVRNDNSAVTETRPSERAVPLQRNTVAARPATPTTAAAPATRPIQSAGDAVNARSNTDPVRDPNARNDPRRATPPSASVNTNIQAPTDEERNASPSTPAEPQR